MKMSSDIFDAYLAASDFEAKTIQLCRLIYHNDERVRMRVAENPRLPRACIEELSRDQSFEVRIAVADNPSAPEEVLRFLANDEHPDVRYAIAENANTPMQLLEVLADDCHPYVAARAKKTLERLRRLAIIPLPAKRTFPRSYYSNFRA